ncbi:MAG TPA: hypothetical protein VJH89_00590 [Patescibacteria group bacterium]|nr:hypothetical protein [Patescibacteria group bacterium]
MRQYSFDSSQQISSALALLFVLVLSATIGWISISTSDDIVRQAKENDSPWVNSTTRSTLLETDVIR